MEKGSEIQAEKRNKIVNIAYGLFIKKGLEKTSIRDIANLADVNVNTLYYYFRTKAEIVICCVEYGLEKISKDIFETINFGGTKQNGDLKALLNYSLKYKEELCWCYQVITSPNYNWLVKDILIASKKRISIYDQLASCLILAQEYIKNNEKYYIDKRDEEIKEIKDDAAQQIINTRKRFEIKMAMLQQNIKSDSEFLVEESSKGIGEIFNDDFYAAFHSVRERAKECGLDTVL